MPNEPLCPGQCESIDIRGVAGTVSILSVVITSILRYFTLVNKVKFFTVPKITIVHFYSFS